MNGTGHHRHQPFTRSFYDPRMLPWLLLAIVIVVAAMAQRITGIGFALITTPVAVLVVGADAAVPFAATIGAVVAIGALITSRRDLQLRRILPLLVAAIIAMVPTLLLARVIPTGWAAIAAGTLVIGSVVVAMTARRGPMPVILGRAPVAGALTGVAAGLAGLAGPMAAAHGTIRGWGASLVPNIQVILLITLPFIIVGHGWPTSVEPISWIGGASAVLVGTIAGSLLASRIPMRAAVVGTRMLALAGGVAAVAQGVVLLAAG